MSKLHELIEKGPALCGAYKPERWAMMFTHAFNIEIADKISAFASDMGERIEDRLDVLNGLFNAKGAEFEKVSYWVSLLTLCAYSYALAKGRDDLRDVHASLKEFLLDQEADHAPIASVMSVQEASVLTTWV